MSCDEAVIKKLGVDVKKEYSHSLLILATGKRIVGGSPLAFGEGGTKIRIKNVLNYKKPAFRVVMMAIIAVITLGIGLASNPKEFPSTVNTIYTDNLSPNKKSEIMTRYQFDVNSNIFETKFHVSDNIKSYIYYVEMYQHGEFLGTYVENYGNFNTKDSSIITAFSINRTESDSRRSMRWLSSFIDGGFATHPNIPFPNGFVPQGVSTNTLTNEGNAEEMTQIIAEQPIIIANIGMHSAQNSKMESYSCDYLMEHPEKIAQYECVYLVKCMFSEKDETELVKILPSRLRIDDNITEENRVDVPETPTDVDVFLNKISQSFQIKEGVARFTIPEQMPKDYEISQLSVHVSGTMPMGDNGSNMSLHAYEKEDEIRNWELGKEYIEKMFDSDAPDGTEVYASFYLMKNDNESSHYTTVEKLFPIREDSFTPSVSIVAVGSVHTLPFSDRFNDKLILTCSLPDGWSLQAPTTGTAQITNDMVNIYADSVQVGSIFYDRFELYRDESGNIPYMSVYNSIMLGSIATWDNEYTEIYKDELTNVASCKPRHNLSLPGVSNANAPTVYSKGILSYHIGASKYIAIELDDGLVNSTDWQIIAKSVKLSL